MRIRSIRNLPRIKDITSTLLRHGLHGLAEALELPVVNELRRLVGRPPEDWQRVAKSLPFRVRNVLQELGPTFVKLGQVLSTRPDVLPDVLIAELTKLQDHVEPMPYEDVASVIAQELGRSIPDLFAHFETEPLAAASIGQVHRARTQSGDDVVVKVQRVGIREVVAADMDILFSLARAMKDQELVGDTYDPVAIVEEFSRSLTRELDYVREMRNICTFQQNFAENQYVKIPRVHEGLCTSRVLVMEYIDGVKASEADRTCHDCPALARVGVEAVLQQVFLDGCFHADPHPGNLFIVGERTICFVDFGMIGRLSVLQRDGLSNILAALDARDYDVLAREIVRVTHPRCEIDLDDMALALMETIDPFYGAQLGKVPVAQMILDCLDVVARFRIRFPASMSLMLKSLMTVESLGRKLDPEFDMFEAIRPFVQRLVLSRFDPGRIKRDGLLAMRDLWGMIERAPWRVDGLLAQAQRGEVTLQVKHRDLHVVARSVEEGSTRLALGAIVAALILGLAIVGRGDGFHAFLGIEMGTMLMIGLILCGLSFILCLRVSR